MLITLVRKYKNKITSLPIDIRTANSKSLTSASPLEFSFFAVDFARLVPDLYLHNHQWS